MNQQSYQEYLNLALECAQMAGTIIREAFYSQSLKAVNFKGNVDLVTETDKKVEKLVTEKIKNKYPTHLFIGEEVNSKNNVCIAIALSNMI
jgi:fructose-1,6-bisphosphatase/inositol monophosphatase family enzyme